MTTLFRTLRFCYLLWGALLLGTLTLTNRAQLPDLVWHWPWLARCPYTAWGRGLLLGIGAAMCLAAFVEVWELVDHLLHHLYHDPERNA